MTTPLSGYAYRQQITVTGGGAAVGGSTTLPVPTTSTDYVVMLHLTGPQAAAVYYSATYNATSLYDGTPFADVTVWYTGGSSPQQLDIDYDTATYGAWSPSNITLSFRLQEPLDAAPATDSGYALAYGNATPTVLRDWANIYPFQDDFTGTAIDATKWTPFGNVSASVTGGVATISSSTIGDNGLKSTSAYGTNYRVSMYGTLPIASSGSRGPALRQWSTPPSPSSMVAIGTNPVNSPTQDEVSTYTVADGWQHTYFAGTADPAYHVFSLARDANGTANGWVDQTSASAPGAASVDALNTVLNVFNNDDTATTTLQADWIKVRPWIPVEPVASVSTGGDVPWHPHRTLRLASGLTASVDLSDGHLDLHAADVSLPARGPDLVLDHTWDSTMATAGVTTTAGQGWQDNLTPGIGGAITGTLVYTDDTGATWPLSYTGALTATSPYTAYQPPAGQAWAITATASTTGTTGYTLTDFLTGASRVFDGQGRLVADRDAYGNANTLGYADGAPTTVTNSGGRKLKLVYQAGTRLLAEAQSPLWQSGGSGAAGSQHISYGYNGSNQLVTLTRGAGTTDAVTATFGYSGTQLGAITPTTALAQPWQLAYDGQGRVIGVTSPASGTTPSYTTAVSYAPGRTTVIEGAGSAAPITTTYDLDAQGEPITVTDALSDTTSYAYDADHDVTGATDARGNTTSYGYQYVGPYGSTGLLTEVDRPAIDSTGPISTAYAYDADFNLAQVTTGNRGITYYDYDSHHSVITATQQLDVKDCGVTPYRTARTARQATQAQAGTIRPSSSCPLTYTWRASVNRIDRYGEITSTVDGRGVDVADTNAGVRPAPTLNASAPLYTSSYTYTAQGDLQQASTPPITSTAPGKATMLAPVVTSYGDDSDGNQTARTSPNGYKTTLAYDHLERPTKVTQPSIPLYTGSTAAPATTLGYDGAGQVAAITSAVGAVTRYGYDPLGRLTSLTNPISGTTTYTYNATALTAMQDPAGNLTRYDYDAAGRRISATDGAGTTTQYAYDGVGNTVAITTPLDAAHPASNTIETRGYDALDEPITDTVGGIGEATSTAPQTTSFTYDRDGNATMVVAPNGAATFVTPDQADRVREIDILAGAGLAPSASTRRSFDAADNLTYQVDYAGRSTTRTVDGADRVGQWTAYDCTACSTALITTTAGYDSDGNALSLTRLESEGGQTGAYTATYNALDWLMSQDDGLGATLYGYDSAGRPRTAALLVGGQAQSAVTATLDAAGQTTRISVTVTDTARAPVTDLTTLTHTPDGLPVTTTLNSGGSYAAREVRGYDRDNRLTALQATGPSGVSAPLAASYGYAYDPQGRTSVITAPVLDQNSPDHGLVLTQQLSHNAVGDLTQADGTLWSADGDGNLLGEYPAGGNATTFAYTYTADSATGGITPSNWLPNELAYAKTYDDQNLYYAYDNGGNTTVITDRAAVLTPFTKTIAYDAAGLPTQVTLSDPTLNTGGTSRVAVTYNARGLRASLAVTPLGQGSPAFTEAFRYRGERVGQVAVAGTDPFTETFVYRPDGSPLELLFQPQGQPTARYWYVLDGQGSVVGLADGTGNLVNTYSYDLWGDHYRGARDAEAIPQPLRYRGYWYDGWYDGGSVTGGTYSGGQNSFQGHLEDAPLPWYWLRRRWYDPYIRRFLEPDPSAQDGVRSYAYAHDDPVDLSDPSGLAAGGTESEDIDGEGSLGAPAGGGFPNGGAHAEPAAPAGAGVQIGATGDTNIADAASDYQQLALPYADASDPTRAGGETDFVQLELFPSTDDASGSSQAEQIGEIATNGAKRGPKIKPYGPHNEMIMRRIGESEADGMIHENGGSKTEEIVFIEGGSKSFRRPDITMKDPTTGQLYRENVGRTLPNGMPVPREVLALQDLARQLGQAIGFTGYDTGARQTWLP